MKRILFVMMTVLCSVSIYGQVALPQVTPTSPEAASLGRYGDFDLTNSTGRMSYSIPIHNISAGAYSWPISLNYSYGGLILEGKPSLNGLGWNLSAYASITKQSRGLPDGHPDGYYGQNNVEAKINAVVADYQNDGQVNTTNWTDLQKFLEKQYDSEVDLYRLNLAGDTFSFKIKRVGASSAQVYGLSKSNYIIQPTVDNTQEFEIASFIVTDDKGIIYRFDADDREEVVQEPAGTTAFADDNTTAWMLSKIEYPTSQVIEFDYQVNSYFDYNFAARATEYDLDASAPGASLQGNYAADWQSDYSDEFRVSEMDRQLLNTITFPSGSIHITRINNQGRLLISKIQVKNLYNTVINTFDFTYQGVRDALVKVEKNGETLYDFEYFGIHTPGNIPAFTQSVTDPKPYDQDYWRFYNQAGNNRALHLPFDGPNFTANKNPNFSATMLGALRRIIYPTKGYTDIAYQQNQVKEDNIPGAGNQNEAFNDGFVISVDAKISNNDRHATITKTFTQPTRAYLYHKVQGNVAHGNSIYLTITETTGSSTSGYGNCYHTTPTYQGVYTIDIADARAKMVETTSCPYYPNPIVKPALTMAYDPDNNCVYYPQTSNQLSQLYGCTSETTADSYGNSGGSFWIPPGTYTFSIDVNHLTYDSLYGEIGLQWHDPSQDPYINVDVGGIRVSRTANYDHTGELTGVTHYDYNDRFGYSTGRQNQIPTLSYRHEWDHIDFDDNTQQYVTTQMVLNEFLLNSYTALESHHGVPVYYESIKTYKSLSLNPAVKTNGVVNQNFYLPEEDVSLIYPLIPRGEDLTKAVKDGTHLRKEDNTTISSTTRDYVTIKPALQSGTDYDASSNHPWSFVYFKRLNNILNWSNGNCYNYNPTCHDNLRSLHDLKLYKEVNSKRYLIQEHNQTDNVITAKTFNYNSYQLLDESTVKTSQGKAVKTKNYYAHDLNNNTLISRNQIAMPIKTETFEGNLLNSNDDVKLATQNTIFMPDGLNYLPEKVQVSKGNNTLEDRIIYHDYDSNGNPLEVSLANGTTISYIWGHNKTLPVAKVENATYDQIEALSSFTTGAQVPGELTTTQEAQLRSISGAMVTTYKYIPLVGVSSITDPRGNTVYYQYDNQNRLVLIKDKDGNIISENQYHLKN